MKINYIKKGKERKDRERNITPH